MYTMPKALYMIERSSIYNIHLSFVLLFFLQQVAQLCNNISYWALQMPNP